MKKSKICIVTVTYGERQHLLKEVISSVEKIDQVNKIIVVNNGANLDGLKDDYYNKLEIIELGENTGSANGYNIGLKKAKESNSDFIMTLDDDNLPEENCINNLLEYYNKISTEVKNNNIALLALREDRIDFKKAAMGKDIKNVFPLVNSFLGWHLKQIPLKIFNKIWGRLKKTNNNILTSFVEYVHVPIAPYGGLFFHRNLLNLIGLPNPKYYLYCDDYDFTYKINNNEGAIYLVPSSKIIDIDKTWFVKENYGFLKSFLMSESDFRIYYGVRNRVYFETRNLVENKLIYSLNRMSFKIVLYVLSILLGKKDRYEMISSSIKNGDKGILGKAKDF